MKILWFLVLRGPHAGEVWCDARSSDGKVRRVAGSFSDWYRGWLDACVADQSPWTAWNWKSCATASILAQLLDKLVREEPEKPLVAGRLAGMVGPGKLTLSSKGGRWFAPDALLDPCAGCVYDTIYWGLDEDIFPSGQPPLHGRVEEPSPSLPRPPKGGRLAGWFRRFKRPAD